MKARPRFWKLDPALLRLQEHGCDAVRGAYSGACLGENRDEPHSRSYTS